MPNIAPAKKGSFRTDREMQFGVCNCDEPHASPHMEREGEHFYRWEVEVGELKKTKKP